MCQSVSKRQQKRGLQDVRVAHQQFPTEELLAQRAEDKGEGEGEDEGEGKG
jgi:hypothetical protein